jgi:hypothetical protein
VVDDITDIADFYYQDPEREHLRLAAHQLEFARHGYRAA